MQMKEGVRKLNKSGRGERASAAVGDDDDNGDVEINYMCIQCNTEQDILGLVCNEEEEVDHGVDVDVMADVNNYNRIVAEVFTEDINIDNEGMVWDY